MRCELNTSECSSGPCLNGGKCIESGNSWSCNCPGGVSGNRCQVVTTATFDGNSFTILQFPDKARRKRAVDLIISIEFTLKTSVLNGFLLGLFGPTNNIVIELFHNNLYTTISSKKELIRLKILLVKLNGIVDVNCVVKISENLVTLTTQPLACNGGPHCFQQSNSFTVEKKFDNVYVGGIPLVDAYTRSFVKSTSRFKGCLSVSISILHRNLQIIKF